jgi:hypothetical protein
LPCVSRSSEVASKVCILKGQWGFWGAATKTIVSSDAWSLVSAGTKGQNKARSKTERREVRWQKRIRNTVEFTSTLKVAVFDGFSTLTNLDRGTANKLEC